MNSFLRYLLPFTFLLYLLVNYACKSKQTGNEQNDQSKISVSADTSQPRRAQKKAEDSAEFNYSDFNDLKRNKRYDRFLAGKLILSTGQVVCADPMYRELALPQSWTVKPGGYPVYLYIGLDDDFEGRVAYAELLFKDEVPANWRLSLIPGDLLADSFEKGMNGMYPVENGLSSFSDYETFKMYSKEIEKFYSANKDGNFYGEVLEPLFKKNINIPKSSRGEDWVNYKPRQANGNIIMFGSGWGDGLYPRYVGYDKDGNVVKMITDFIRINGHSDDE